VGQALRELTPHRSPIHFFGHEVRHWRLLRGLSASALGQAVSYTRSAVSLLELGDRVPTPALARRLDEVLDTGGVLQRLMPAVEAFRKPPAPARQWPDDLGLGWPVSAAAAATNASQLWQADLADAAELQAISWSPQMLDEPLRAWVAEVDRTAITGEGGRRVGYADVDALWAMSRAFSDADHRLGGGHVRRTLLTYLDQVLGPLLQGTYTSETGRALYAAAGRLLNLSAFMCFDAGHHPLAGRYFIQALAMVDASGDDALTAHVLTDMAMQAHYMRRPALAARLAEAAIARARQSGSACSTARSYAVQARALALWGNATGSDHSLSQASSALDNADIGDEPHFVRFFDHRQLATEAMYAAHDLGRWTTVQASATITTADDQLMQRRHVLATTTLASSYLTDDRTIDVPQACQLLGAVTPLVPSLASARGLASINKVRRALRPYIELDEVRRVEAELIEALCSSA
jgi:transcriptional regulator with XRE-family HTH domain